MKMAKQKMKLLFLFAEFSYRIWYKKIAFLEVSLLCRKSMGNAVQDWNIAGAPSECTLDKNILFIPSS